MPLWKIKQWQEKSANCQRRGWLPREPGDDPATVELHLAVSHAVEAAVFDYRLRALALAVPLTVFPAQGERRADRTPGRGGLAQGRVRGVAVAGTHQTMVKWPQVRA